MAKPDTVKDIKAANGADLNPEDYTQKELDALLELAKGGDATRAQFDELAASAKNTTRPSNQNDTTGTSTGTTSTASTPKVKTVTVRVNDAIAAYGGEFTDPETHAVIGKDAVDVPQSAFVREKLRSDEIVEAE